MNLIEIKDLYENKENFIKKISKSTYVQEN